MERRDGGARARGERPPRRRGAGRPQRLEERLSARDLGGDKRAPVGEPPVDARREHLGRCHAAAAGLGRDRQLAQRSRAQPEVGLPHGARDEPTSPIEPDDGAHAAGQRDAVGRPAARGDRLRTGREHERGGQEPRAEQRHEVIADRSADRGRAEQRVARGQPHAPPSPRLSQSFAWTTKAR